MKVKKHNLDTAINEQIELISPIQERQAELEESIAQNQGTIADIEESISNTNEQVDNLSLKIGDTSTLETANKDDLVSALNEVFQLGNDVKSGLINVITSKDSESGLDADSSFDSIIAYLENKGLSDVVKRISHTTPAEPNNVVSLEFDKAVLSGSEFDNISLINETDGDGTNVITSKTLTGFADGTAFSENENRVLNLLVDEGLIPNRDYRGEIPIEALRDEEGNVVAGAYIFRFRTRSVIAEQGNLQDFEALSYDGSVFASWKNPNNIDLVRIVAKRSQTDYPSDINSEGTVVYDQLGESFVDSDVSIGQSYYYTLFAFDSIGEYNSQAKFKVIAKSEPLLIITPDVSMEELSRIINNMSDNTEILFTEGDFLIDSPIYITRSNISLRGSQGTTLKRNHSNSSLNSVIYIEGTQSNPLQNISVKNMVIDGVKDFGNELIDCIIVEYAGDFSTGLTGVTIEECKFVNSNGYGMHLNYADNSFVSKNSMVNNTLDGVIVTSSKGSTIANNTIKVDSTEGMPFSGASFSDSSNLIITSNYIENFGYSALGVTNCSNATISKNSIQNGGYGMLIESLTNGLVSSNNLTDNPFGGINISSSKNVNITGNAVLRGANGIVASNSEAINLTGNSLSDFTDYGIQTNNTSHSIVGANVSVGSGLYGVSMGGDEATSSYNTASLNVSKNLNNNGITKTYVLANNITN